MAIDDELGCKLLPNLDGKINKHIGNETRIIQSLANEEAVDCTMADEKGSNR